MPTLTFPMPAPVALTAHPALRVAKPRLTQAKKRDDYTITAITFGPTHRFNLAHNFWPHTMVNDGDFSIAVEYHFSTSPNRPRREVFNTYTEALDTPLWDILNAHAAAR